ncbi:MAG: hypothetical protein ABEJ05_09490 [Haloglomus sp.]
MDENDIPSVERALAVETGPHSLLRITLVGIVHLDGLGSDRLQILEVYALGYLSPRAVAVPSALPAVGRPAPAPEGDARRKHRERRERRESDGQQDAQRVVVELADDGESISDGHEARPK